MLVLLFPLLLVLVACNDDADDAVPVTPTPTPTATETPAPTPTPTPTPEVAVCLRGDPFIDDGPVDLDGTEAGDAAHVGEYRWAAHEGCERLVIDLVDADGNPAGSAGAVEAEVIRGLGIVRISLLDVDPAGLEAIGTTEAMFDGPLAHSAYTVWSPDGTWSMVDIQLGEAAEAHVAVLDDPARVVVDLRPGGGPIPEPAATNDLVVVLEPRPGQASYPLTVTGYARTFEANVVVRIEQDGEERFSDFTTATSWADAWGYFSLTIEDGPEGAIELHVGEHSARDGEWQGAMVPLEMR